MEALTPVLAAYCDEARVYLAAERVVVDILTDFGMVMAPPPVATAATATLAGIGPNSATLSHWTLAPAFALDTFEYAFAAANDTFLPVVTLGFPGQAVFWKHGQNAYEGIMPTLALASGENVIKIIVVSQDGLQRQDVHADRDEVDMPENEFRYGDVEFRQGDDGLGVVVGTVIRYGDMWRSSRGGLRSSRLALSRMWRAKTS